MLSTNPPGAQMLLGDVLGVSLVEMYYSAEGSAARTGLWPEGSEGSSLRLISFSSWNQVPSPWGGLMPAVQYLNSLAVIASVMTCPSCSHWAADLFWFW